MYYWRVTKYNPKYRKNKKYVNNEWTTISDVGKSFNNTEFTFEEYLEYEKKYINAIILAMQESEIDNFVIEELEKNVYEEYPDLSETKAKEFYDSLKNGMPICTEKIGLVTKLILREMIWGKLISDSSFIHFGYDYYMYFGFEKDLKNARKSIENTRLFVENIRSPYLDNA
ncbi:MAG: hypothetical protein PHQ72_12550 [Hespellia sp.]|nr:hypothetical protein [Hespellia sp.]